MKPYLSEGEELLPSPQVQHLAGGVAGGRHRAVAPGRKSDASEASSSRGECVLRLGVEEVGLGPGQVGRAFVDLVGRDWG